MGKISSKELKVKIRTKIKEKKVNNGTHKK